MRNHIIMNPIWAWGFLGGCLLDCCSEFTKSEVFLKREVAGSSCILISLEKLPQGFIQVFSPCGFADSCKIGVKNVSFLLCTCNLLPLMSEGFRVLFPFGPF